MDHVEELLQGVANGDSQALEELFALHRDRLLAMVGMRLDRRLRGRIGASDVIQDTHAEAVRRLAAYLADPKRMPFFLWLRFLARQRLAAVHRRELGTRRRDAGIEVQLHQGPLPQATSAELALQLVGDETAPSQAAARAEQRLKIERALDSMDPLDREVIVLRHFEQLSNTEAARELGLGESASSKRYLRALRKLKEVLPGTLEGELER